MRVNCRIVVLIFSLAFTCITADAFAQILPKPLKVEMEEGTFVFPSKVSIYQKDAKATQKYLSQHLKSKLGWQVAAAPKASKATIRLVNTNTNKSSEAYKLSVDKSGITIEAESETGVYYGVQSLRQLISNNSGVKISIPAQKIEDSPRFSWRSFMLDESRYFKGEEEVKMLLDVMADLKMNIFHWHLVDDQGWRVEIKKYPLLTQVGSKRKDTQIGGWNSEKRSGVPHEGFYTQAQIKRIVKYAQERHIKIVPEIEMPGHASAAIAAYPWLGASNEKIEVPVTFGKHYAAFNVIDPKVKQFLKDVVAEVIVLFQTDVVHIGGDEVRFDQWEANPAIQKYKKDKGYSSFMDIQIEFTNEMSRFIAQKGASMMGWNEILGKNLHADDNISFSDPTQKIASNVIVQFWKGELKEMTQAAQDGYRLVNSYHSYTYLDYSYDNISLKKAYSFEPIPEGLPTEYGKNIFGIGCQMWGEWIPTVKDMQRQIFPRIAAYAEVGWSAPSKDYDDFVRRLKPIVQSWKKQGVNVQPVKELE